jgi:outer membrane protein TolC
MNNILKYIFLLAVSLLAFAAPAQDAITLQQAIEAALKNSFDVQIAKNNEKISQNNASLGNAGMLPEVGLNAAQNNSITDTHQEFATGNTIDRNGANANSLTAGIGLDWTLFDGFRMFTTYDKLKEFESRGEVITKLQIQQAVSDITQQYYDVVRLQEAVKVLEEAVKLSDDRINIAREKLKIGAGSNYDLLQSQLDQNRDKSQLLRLQGQLTTARVFLNQLMGREPSTQFVAADTAIAVKTVGYDESKKAFMEKNQQLRLAQVDIRIAILELKETKSQRFPRLSFNSGYNFTRANSEAGLVSANQSTGMNFGFTLTYPLFSGFNVNRQVKNAKIGVENAQLESQKATLELGAMFEISYRNYESAQQLAALERTNLDIAKQNMEIANEKMRIGSISSLEFRDVQVKYTEARNNLLDAMYNVKASETQLLFLSDMLYVQ